MINVVLKKPTDIDRQQGINYLKTITIINDKGETSYIKTLRTHILGEIDKLLAILETNKAIINNIDKQYTHIKIPKRKGGYREIVDPSPELKELQRYISNFLQNTLLLHTHNAAHAYIKKRDILTNANVHKSSKMFLTLDIHNFFGSISKETLKNELLKLNNIAYFENQKPFLDKLLEPCVLNNVLPQGSPTSPLLSNLIMIEFDEKISNMALSNRLKYTRYADDLFISGEEINKPEWVKRYVQNQLHNISKDLNLNDEKTKILRPGKCYLAGIKINKENKLTFGHEQKTNLKHNIYNLFIKDINNECSKEEVQEILGLFSYAHRIEPAYFNYIETKYLKQFKSKSKTLTEHFKKYL